jgi:mono/diheme cytochrome c family protein
MTMRLASLLLVLASLSACAPAETGACPNDLPAGCPPDAPGYAATIAPLLAEHCVSCHGPGGVSAEKPLGTWADVSARKGAVLDQVYACKMPQPPATLPAEARAALLGWLVCGAPND